jgi:hypothetical protein
LEVSESQPSDESPSFSESQPSDESPSFGESQPSDESPSFNESQPSDEENEVVTNNKNKIGGSGKIYELIQTDIVNAYLRENYWNKLIFDGPDDDYEYYTDDDFEPDETMTMIPEVETKDIEIQEEEINKKRNRSEEQEEEEEINKKQKYSELKEEEEEINKKQKYSELKEEEINKKRNRSEEEEDETDTEQFTQETIETSEDEPDYSLQENIVPIRRKIYNIFYPNSQKGKLPGQLPRQLPRQYDKNDKISGFGGKKTKRQNASTKRKNKKTRRKMKLN